MSDMSPNSPARAAWKSVRASMIIAGVQIVVTFLLVLAHKRGLIDGETTMRGVLATIGLMLAALGNRIPKSQDGQPLPTVPLAVLRQKTMRAAGWAMMLGGLVFSGVWLFAPIDLARTGSMIALGGSIAVMSGFVVRWIFTYHHRYERQPESRDEP